MYYIITIILACTFLETHKGHKELHYNHSSDQKTVLIIFLCDSGIVGEDQGMSENAIRRAYSATERDFLSQVKKQWISKPEIASTGTCCLVGIICNGLLYVANAGDSRVVLGRFERSTREIEAIQLSAEHNVNIETVRDEIRSKHPFDPQIVVVKHNVWRVKGLIQVQLWKIYVTS